MNDKIITVYNSKGERHDVPESIATPEVMKKFNYTFENPLSKNTQTTQQPEKNKALNDLLYKGIIGAGNFSKGAVLGGVEGLADSASSVGNIPIELINSLYGSKIPTMGKANLERYLPPDSSAAKMGFEAGNFAGELGSGGAAFKVAGSIPKLSNEASLLQNLARGGLSGAAIGENMPGGREGAAIYGAPAGLANQLTYKALAQNIVGKSANSLDKSKEFYREVFSKIPKDQEVIPEGNIDFKRIRKNIPLEQRKAIDDFDANPTIENAHNAQSELGSYIRELRFTKENAKKTGVGFKKNNLLRSMIESQSSIKKALGEGLVKSGMDNYNNYNNAQRYYQKYVLPYDSKGTLQKYKNNEMFDDEFVKKMMKNAKFMKSAPGSENSTLKARKFINSLVNKQNVLPASALSILGINAYDKFNPNSSYGDQ